MIRENDTMKRFLVATVFLTGFAGSALAGDPTTPGTVFQDCPTCPKMVVIPAGTFLMGQDKNTNNWENKDNGSNELPQHQVTIHSIFAVGAYQVTQAEYLAVMGDNPSQFTVSSSLPVDSVLWSDAVSFVMKLSYQTGKLYRLPSEAEWEYVARAGTQTPYFFTNKITNPPIPWALLGQYAWYSNTSGGSTHPVGMLKPNQFGLYDIYGNVWEWVADCFHKNYVGAPTDGSAWVTPSRCNGRVIRGASWTSDNPPIDQRSAYRNYNPMDMADNSVGFRIARAITP